MFSAEDLPDVGPCPPWLGGALGDIVGLPVVDFRGEPHRVVSSPCIPKGQVYVYDEAAAGDDPYGWTGVGR